MAFEREYRSQGIIRGTEATGLHRYRLVPPAVTPLSWQDILAGIHSHVSGTGRAEFSEAVREYLDGESVGTFTSYRRALTACLRALSDDDADPGRRERIQVAVPAFCSGDYVAAVEAAGLEMVRYDVDPSTLAADMDAIEELSRDDLLAIVVVNVLGYGSPLSAISEYCDDNDVYLVEALGYGLGGQFEGSPLGTVGDCSVLNFQQGKPIPVGGGMVISRRKTIHVDDFGREPVSPNVGLLTGYKFFSHPSTYYWFERGRELVDRFAPTNERPTTHPGTKDEANYDGPFETLSDFQGGVAHQIFDRLEATRQARERTAMQYRAAFDHLDELRSVEPIQEMTVQQYVRYPLLIDSTERRTALRTALRHAGIHATTLYDWPPLDEETYPGAARIQREILTLPTHPKLDTGDRVAVIETVRSICER